jgi:hypothetical protein
MRPERYQPQDNTAGQMWALTVLVSLLGLFFLWAVAVHPTPQERSGVYDRLGKTTGVNWARPDETRER